VMAALVVAIVWLGLAPQPVLNAAAPALEGLRQAAEAMLTAGR
jgi:NADH:ubiquinone oxidoreductase subunit 4 (subunit M)